MLIVLKYGWKPWLIKCNALLLLYTIHAMDYAHGSRFVVVCSRLASVNSTQFLGLINKHRGNHATASMPLEVISLLDENEVHR